MNIIELFENATIYKEGKTELTFDDTILVKKQFEIEKNQNPNLDSKVANDLILAINDHPKTLNFIVNNRVLYNFFSNKEYSRNRFTPQTETPENVKIFIDKFLSKDLESILLNKFSENKFEYLDDFLSASKDYLPQNALAKLQQLLSEKLDFVCTQLNQISDYAALVFIKQRSFYDLLSHFSSPENDIKVRAIYDKMMFSNDMMLKTQFETPFTMAIANYKATDNNLTNLLKSSKEQSLVNNIKTSSSGSSAMSIGSIIILVIILIRLILLMVRCSQ